VDREGSAILAKNGRGGKVWTRVGNEVANIGKESSSLVYTVL